MSSKCIPNVFFFHLIVVLAFLLHPENRRLRVSAEAAKTDPAKVKAFQIIEAQAKQLAKINDAIFSYSEPGYQEFKTVELLVKKYQQAGFQVETGVAGMPTAFVAVWGKGKPVIALMAEFDGQLESSQKPAAVKYDPIVEGAPGHGEGHNANPVVVYGAAVALKAVMESSRLSGTIKVIGAPAEEYIGSRAFMLKAGVWDDVDVGMDCHIGRNAKVLYGWTNGTRLSVVFEFNGAAREFPFVKRSALEGIELMTRSVKALQGQGLPSSGSTRYVITHGGDTPAFTPQTATVWYSLHERNVDDLMKLYAKVKEAAEAAATKTGTTVEAKILAGSWQLNQNKALTEITHANMVSIGMPEFSEDDHAFFRAYQKSFRAEPVGVNYKIIEEIQRPQSTSWSDAGDVTWVIPSTRLHFPGQFFITGEEYQGDPVRNHQWTQAVTVATPVAHKGIVFGAKVMAATFIDILQNPEHLKRIQADFKTQTAGYTYRSLIPDGVKPQLDVNKAVMEKYRPLLEKFYYDPESSKSYMEMLGLKYPPD